MSAQTPPPLLRDFIDIPERTATSDSEFVLKLAEGISDAEQTLRDYVIPPGLVNNFDQALGLITSALSSGASRAAYLHGSFGAGKSHFMAVLHALLRGERAARDRDEFAPLLTRYDPHLAGRKFLLVPYHLIGAKSLEQRALGGYLEQIRLLHPEAPIPAVHRTEALLDQSRHLRAQIGDAKFIAGLPGGDKPDNEWGDDESDEAGSAWDTARLDAAFAAAPDDEARRQLVTDLLSTWQQGFFRNALEDAEGFIALDRGLTVIAGHAKDLGYDALVLFLDELILWLANNIGDQQFVSREVQKITNFIEGSDARRPIPVITFIARQRDLREMVGQEVTGATELGFQDTLNLASGRFDVISLEDRNLPEITRKRLLKRIGGDGGPADQAISAAFERMTRVRADVWDTLLGTDTGTGADLESFRKTYPFSPAFLATLVHVSSALQRSRTALKLMRQLLMERREELRLGQLIPLGDLYDVLSRGGDQPFTEKLKVEFEMAQKLYQNRLRPYLLEQHRVTDDELIAARQGLATDPQLTGRIKAFTGDDRLIKTLLLAALAPSVPALHNLTARKLSALNHGSITSPIPGGEVGAVIRRIEDWAGKFGEIKMVGDDGVRLDLVGVDVDSVLNAVRGFDTTAARQQMVKRLLWEELGITESGEYLDQANLVWRGSRRSIEVIFGNVRDAETLRDENFHPFERGSWRLIVDYPFDEGTYTSADDRNRVQELSRRFTDQVVCWVPAALTIRRQSDLGRLVVLDRLLAGKQFDTHAKHFSEDDRRRALTSLTSQRDTLLVSLRTVLRQAYGVATKKSEDVQTSYDEHLLSLAGDTDLTLPIGARMGEALRHLADQLFTRQFPAHPEFDPDRKGEAVRAAELGTVFGYVRKAVESPDGRAEVDRKDRATVRRIVNPLRLGEMHESAFVLGRHWVEHFNRQAVREGVDGDLRVPDLLRWIDEPQAHGLERPVANLLLAAFAEQTDRSWIRHGSVLGSEPDLRIIDDLSLRDPQLPDPADWTLALERAGHLFGLNGPKLARGRLVALFAQEVKNQAKQQLDAADALLSTLNEHAKRLGLDPDTPAGRLRTANAVVKLLKGLDSAGSDVEIVRRLAHADLGGPAPRAARSISSATEVTRALRSVDWDTITTISELGEPWNAESERIIAALRQAAADDELTTRLAPTLSTAREQASLLLRKVTKAAVVPRPRDGSPQRVEPHRVEPHRVEPHRVEPARIHNNLGSSDGGPVPVGRTVTTVIETRPGASGTLVTGADGLADALASLRDVVTGADGRQVEITWRVLD